LETRAQREARQLGATPRPARARSSGSSAAGGRGLPFGLSGASLAIAAGVIAFVAVLGYVVIESTKDPGPPAWRTAELNDSTNLPGVYYPPHPGFDGVPSTGDERQHVNNNSPVPICTDEQIAAGTISSPLCYTSNPPTSGPHAISPLAFKVLDNPAPKENLIHNMEHGGVVVWYNTDDQATIDRLASIVNNELDRGRLVVMSKYTEMEPEMIALTSWTRLDKFPVSGLDDNRVRDFIETHQRRFNPEGL
jgi:hypothetical protein